MIQVTSHTAAAADILSAIPRRGRSWCMPRPGRHRGASGEDQQDQYHREWSI